MKIDYCSDLHVDAWFGGTQLVDPAARRWTGDPHKSLFLHIDWRRYKNPESQVLVIAGDISNDPMTSLQVVEAASQEYEYVVVVEGNHDHYDSDMLVEDGSEFFNQQLKKFSNVTYLNGDNYLVLDGVACLGNMGWYDFKAYEDRGIPDFLAKMAWNKYSNDSRYPKFGEKSPESLAALHSVQLANQVVDMVSRDDIHSIVVTTHMSPRSDIMEWKENDIFWNHLTPSYVNTGMKSVIQTDTAGKIRYWIYGHTHHRKVTEIEGVTYVNNARGYPRENPVFTLSQIEVKDPI